MMRASHVAGVACIAWALVGVRTGAAQQPPQVQSVRTRTDVGTTVVVVEGRGTLPIPTAGSLENPPRNYLDLGGTLVAGSARATVPGEGVVRRTRVALFAANVTRVVLDLVTMEPFRIDTSERAAGRITIVVGGQALPAVPTPAPPSAATLPPTPSAPADPAAASAAPAPPPLPESAAAIATPVPRPRPAYVAPPSAIKLPSRDVERYRQRLAGAIDRLEAQQPVLALLDAQASVGVQALRAADTVFANVCQGPGEFKPSASLASTHRLLIASCTLGALATRLALEAGQSRDPQGMKNAASAAAGALMSFEGVCADIGCTPRPR
ncbi:MAG: AMIN domain-containing protein [Acidobacteria bacterium]|nr:AMIN domain-containing protein [Acidobacteriota bacterium]